MENQNAVEANNRILFATLRKEKGQILEHTTAWTNWKSYAEWNKLDTGGQMPPDATSLNYLEQTNS